MKFCIRKRFLLAAIKVLLDLRGARIRLIYLSLDLVTMFRCVNWAKSVSCKSSIVLSNQLRSCKYNGPIKNNITLVITGRFAPLLLETRPNGHYLGL